MGHWGQIWGIGDGQAAPCMALVHGWFMGGAWPRWCMASGAWVVHGWCWCMGVGIMNRWNKIWNVLVSFMLTYYWLDAVNLMGDPQSPKVTLHPLISLSLSFSHPKSEVFLSRITTKPQLALVWEVQHCKSVHKLPRVTIKSPYYLVLPSLPFLVRQIKCWA